MTEEVYNVNEPIVVSTGWLSERIGEEGIVAVDVRAPYFFGQAHIPGAVNLPPFFLRGQDGGPPPPDDFARRLGDLGLTPDTHIVAYDEGGSPAAAGLYWVLRYYRHPRVSVLDGGITRWRHEGRDWEYSVRIPTPGRYAIGQADPDLYAEREDVLAAVDDPDRIVLDVRAPAEFLGLQASAKRNGHVPGAINFEWSNALQPDADGLPVLRPLDDVRALLTQAGVSEDKEVIVHCQSGGRSAYAFMVLDALGYPRVRHYSRGWQEWGNREDTPVEEG